MKKILVVLLTLNLVLPALATTELQAVSEGVVVASTINEEGEIIPLKDEDGNTIKAEIVEGLVDLELPADTDFSRPIFTIIQPKDGEQGSPLINFIPTESMAEEGNEAEIVETTVKDTAIVNAYLSFINEAGENTAPQDVDPKQIAMFKERMDKEIPDLDASASPEDELKQYSDRLTLQPEAIINSVDGIFNVAPEHVVKTAVLAGKAAAPSNYNYFDGKPPALGEVPAGLPTPGLLDPKNKFVSKVNFGEVFGEQVLPPGAFVGVIPKDATTFPALQLSDKVNFSKDQILPQGITIPPTVLDKLPKDILIPNGVTFVGLDKVEPNANWPKFPPIAMMPAGMKEKFQGMTMSVEEYGTKLPEDFVPPPGHMGGKDSVGFPHDFQLAGDFEFTNADAIFKFPPKPGQENKPMGPALGPDGKPIKGAMAFEIPSFDPSKNTLPEDAKFPDTFTFNFADGTQAPQKPPHFNPPKIGVAQDLTALDDSSLFPPFKPHGDFVPGETFMPPAFEQGLLDKLISSGMSEDEARAQIESDKASGGFFEKAPPTLPPINGGTKGGPIDDGTDGANDGGPIFNDGGFVDCKETGSCQGTSGDGTIKEPVPIQPAPNDGIIEQPLLPPPPNDGTVQQPLPPPPNDTGVVINPLPENEVFVEEMSLLSTGSWTSGNDDSPKRVHVKARSNATSKTGVKLAVSVATTDKTTKVTASKGVYLVGKARTGKSSAELPLLIDPSSTSDSAKVTLALKDGSVATETLTLDDTSATQLVTTSEGQSIIMSTGGTIDDFDFDKVSGYLLAPGTSAQTMQKAIPLKGTVSEGTDGQIITFTIPSAKYSSLTSGVYTVVFQDGDNSYYGQVTLGTLKAKTIKVKVLTPNGSL